MDDSDRAVASVMILGFVWIALGVLMIASIVHMVVFYQADSFYFVHAIPAVFATNLLSHIIRWAWRHKDD